MKTQKRYNKVTELSRAELPNISVEEKELHYERFLKFLQVIFANEGGLSNHKLDKGGITKYGISLKFLVAERIDINKDGRIDANDILWLTKEQAEKLYYEYFYLRVSADKIKNDAIALQVFDIAVNSGVGTAGKLLQKTVRNLGSPILIDGRVGSKTLSLVNSLDSKRLNNNLVSTRISFYESIVNSDPSQVVHQRGWTNRAKRFLLTNN